VQRERVAPQRSLLQAADDQAGTPPRASLLARVSSARSVDVRAASRHCRAWRIRTSRYRHPERPLFLRPISVLGHRNEMSSLFLSQMSGAPDVTPPGDWRFRPRDNILLRCSTASAIQETVGTLASHSSRSLKNKPIPKYSITEWCSRHAKSLTQAINHAAVIGFRCHNVTI